MWLVRKKSNTEEVIRLIAPQAIILLILTVFLVIGAVIFQYLDPELERQSFYEVIFFEFITISTIGYGNQYPQTRASRLFSIVFSIIGIPLLVVTLGNFGKYLTKFYWKVHGRVFGRGTNRELVNDADIPGQAIAVLYLLTLAFGFLFIPHTGASYSIDDFYFSFISFATVGFGDKTPHINTFGKFCKVITYLAWGTILNIILISYVSNWLGELISYTRRQPFRGRDVEVLIGGNCITVSEITALVAKQFHASPREVRAMLHEIDDLMASHEKKEEGEDQ